MHFGGEPPGNLMNNTVLVHSCSLNASKIVRLALPGRGGRFEPMDSRCKAPDCKVHNAPRPHSHLGNVWQMSMGTSLKVPHSYGGPAGGATETAAVASPAAALTGVRRRSPFERQDLNCPRHRPLLEQRLGSAWY